MKELPILFTGAMVRALLQNTKTQTRRIMKKQPFNGRPTDEVRARMIKLGALGPDESLTAVVNGARDHGFVNDPCPYGEPGDRLYVRETWAEVGTMDPGLTVYRADYPACVPSHYENVPPAEEITWKPSIHMRRAASRITLEITDVRVERLQCISEADARAEGVSIEDRHMNGYCAGEYYPPAIRAYRELWESINGAGSWNANQWVWIVEFRRVANEVT